MPKFSTTLTISVLALVAAVGVSYKMGKLTCSGTNKSCLTSDETQLLNSAFVFVKPHANTEATQKLVREKLIGAGITILSESEVAGETIDEKKLIDQHYYAIASKATILPAEEIPVPADKFESSFGETWEKVISEKRAVNALDACEKFGCDSAALNEAWGKTNAVKFGGGFYCGLVSMNGKELYVFNAFFMSMRAKFVGKETSIHTYEVQWDPATLSWSDFRNQLLGPTDPADGPEGSIRKTILESYKELGLDSVPDKGDNGVHASASPFEGLAEKNNWLGVPIGEDGFGKALLNAGLSEETIKAWSVDPRVEQPEGGKGSVFDSLEDMDVSECLSKLVELNALNK
mmetsp:Transcript_30988/g.36162  ORF Transcript_30988/g.36162 Transcript_30988/m.36162 type:complete len:346 (-) Transcript_30988:15-1052(-)